MSLRNRLTLLFSGIVSVSLGIFCLFIYVIAEQHRQREFQGRLRAEAMMAGHMLLGEESVSPSLYKLMDKNELTVLPKEEIIIYTNNYQLFYESGTDYVSISRKVMDRVRRAHEVYTRVKERETVGILFTAKTNSFLIFTSAIDTYGRSNLQNLALILTIGWILMNLLMLFAGRFIAGRILHPISQINQRIDEITASRLSLRLPEGVRADELSQLANRFNRMLNRLEEAFRIQRSFVSHASHELRTPLTAITGQLEVSLLADDDLDEVRTTLHSVLEDVRGLNELTNGLMALTNASVELAAVPLSAVDMENLIKQTQAELIRLHPAYTVQLSIEVSDNAPLNWTVKGNESLLRTALINLMDNGCKFSDNHTVQIFLSRKGSDVQLIFRNTGASIPPDQLTDIFNPFQRGRNATKKPGHGIGLSLIKRIIDLHEGSIAVESSPNEGTTFTVLLT